MTPRKKLHCTSDRYLVDGAHIFELIVFLFTCPTCFLGNNTVQHIYTMLTCTPLSLSTGQEFAFSLCSLNSSSTKAQPGSTFTPGNYPTHPCIPPHPTPSLATQTPSHPNPNPPHPSHSNPTQFMWEIKIYIISQPMPTVLQG